MADPQAELERQRDLWKDTAEKLGQNVVRLEARNEALLQALKKLLKRVKWAHAGADTCGNVNCSGCAMVRETEKLLEG